MAYKFKRVAHSLEILRQEINLAYPGRPTGSDGALGDTAHANRVSDHNPNYLGIVCARDFTEWVTNGVEMNDVLAEFLRKSRDSRIKYVISDGKMFSSYPIRGYYNAWMWRPYNGVNKHTKHVHVSVHGNYDDRRPWGFTRTKYWPKPHVVSVIPIRKKDYTVEILDPEDSLDMYMHLIGVGLIKMTDGNVNAEYERVYPRLLVNMGWIKSLQDVYS
jgi:hypothetical protein